MKSVRKKFFTWTNEVEKKGLEEVRKVGGFHDEPIRSQPGKRSVRLSEGYRLCYESVTENGVTELVVLAIFNSHKNSSYCH